MVFAVKKWFIRQLRKPKTTVLTLIILLGLVMIFVPGNHSVIKGVGISLLASGVMAIVSIFFINDEDTLKTAKAWGLEHVYATRGEMNASCDEYMKHAKSIKAIGFGFRSLRDSQVGSILKILERGGNIKLLTMKPDCDALQLREKDENQEIGASVKDLIEWANDINTRGFSGKIEIRYHDHIPPDFMFMMNNRLFTGPYEYGKLSQQTISFEYNVAGAAYEYYENHFDSLWNNKKFCSDALH